MKTRREQALELVNNDLFRELIENERMRLYADWVRDDEMSSDAWHRARALQWVKNRIITLASSDEDAEAAA